MQGRCGHRAGPHQYSPSLKKFGDAITRNISSATGIDGGAAVIVSGVGRAGNRFDNAGISVVHVNAQNFRGDCILWPLCNRVAAQWNSGLLHQSLQAHHVHLMQLLANHGIGLIHHVQVAVDDFGAHQEQFVAGNLD